MSQRSNPEAESVWNFWPHLSASCDTSQRPFTQACSKAVSVISSHSSDKTEAFPARDPHAGQTGLTWADYSSIPIMGIAIITMVFNIRMPTVTDSWLHPFTWSIQKPNGAKSWSKISPSRKTNGSSTPQLSAHYRCILQAPVWSSSEPHSPWCFTSTLPSQR